MLETNSTQSFTKTSNNLMQSIYPQIIEFCELDLNDYVVLSALSVRLYL